MAVNDAAGNIQYHLKSETPKTETADEIAELICNLAEKSCKAVESIGRVRAFTIAVPGTVNPFDEVISHAPNVPSLENFNSLKSSQIN
jgi:predicted NBD/HSP70 family sugar kinase